jgi:NADP-dependent 3-hydroxy acid dehydrogenase YdfG
MQDLVNRVAVITGAASGVGKGIAQQLAKEGMKLVLADIEEQPLAETEKELRATGTHTLAVVTDVSMRESAREHPQNRLPQTIGARVTEIASGVIDRLRQQRRSLAGYQKMAL